MAEEMDERFSKVTTDPRFRTLRKSDKRVKVDKRFESMFTEKRFKLKYSVDKRGKHRNQNNSEEYKKFYNLSNSEKVGEEEGSGSESESETKSLKKPKIPNARGIGSDDESQLSSSSSSDSEESSDENSELDHKWNEWDKDVAQTESATKRFAICNIDWERINANDLFVLINSFKPSGGSVLSVQIYPSELGLQRMEAEAQSGPIQFIKSNGEDREDKEDSEDEEAQKESNNEEHTLEEPNEEDMDLKTTEQLRHYEMTRLQYYYAVVECDSEATADLLYGELDGMEYESSSSTLDLRFIPEDMTFEEVEPKSECHSMPDLNAYKAPQFVTSALQQSKVRMTWDETDPKRKDVFDRAFNKQEEDDDLKAYLASSDDEDDPLIPEFDEQELPDKEVEKINKYKELLNGLNEPKDDKSEGNLDLEISWEPNLKDMAEDMVNKKERQKDISTFEQNFIKKKEKRKERAKQLEDCDYNQSNDNHFSYNRAENRKNRTKQTTSAGDPNLELLFMDSSDNSDKKHFNYKNIIESESNDKKRKQKTNDSFNFDADDPRFGAVYTSHHYNVDPSDPHFKKTEAFDQIMSRSTKKIKSKDFRIDSNVGTDGNGSSRNSWTQLVRTVKNKTQIINNNNNNENKLQTKQNKFKS